MTSPAADPAASVAAEFEASTRRLGIEVPAHLLGGVLLGHRSLTGLAALLREAEDGLGPAADQVVPGA